MVRFPDISPRIARIRKEKDAIIQGKNLFLNTERTKLYTEYYRTHLYEHPLMLRAGAMYYWVENREINVWPDDIFVGSSAPQKRTISTSVEWGVQWIKDITDEATFKQTWQSGDNVHMTDEQRLDLLEAYDFWKDQTIMEKMRGIVTEDFWGQVGNGGCFGSGFPGTPNEDYFGLGGIAVGHYIGGFNKVVNKGFAAVKEEALKILEEHKGKVFGDWAKKHIFYYAVVKVCDAAILLAKRYAKACRDMAESEEGAERKDEFLWMADSLDWIMEKPARTYWEALQAVLLYQLMQLTDAQQHAQSIGRLDQYVDRVLKAQLADGTLSIEQAQEYTDAFVLRLTDFMSCHTFYLNNKKILGVNNAGGNLYSSLYEGEVPSGHNVITIGGCDPEGNDASNEATKLILNTVGRLSLPDPTTALRVGDYTPDDIWELAIESSKRAGGIPQFENDAVIIPTLLRRGFTQEDANGYSIVGCVEPAGTGNDWPACGNTGAESVWNMMELLQVVINGGVNPRTGIMAKPCKKLYEYESFEELKQTFADEMKYCLDWSVSYASMYELAYSTYFPCIVASTLIDGCMESGLDATEGGAKYNRSGITACGTANVADSLMAINQLCFKEKSVSLKELYDALQADWEGYEELREKIIHQVPHYGNNNEEVDELASWALGLFADIMAEEQGPRGPFYGGTFTMTAHVPFGASLGATPDGRKAGEPIADAISPRQGFDKCGPTAYLLSASKLPHNMLGNGDQANIRFSPSSVEGFRGTEKLRDLIRSYFKMGGMQIQFNVVSTDVLKAAKANPMDYRDLVVRIAGFSTYFVSLTPDVQDDFITRTEQNI